jgi:hypothetical protein
VREKYRMRFRIVTLIFLVIFKTHSLVAQPIPEPEPDYLHKTIATLDSIFLMLIITVILKSRLHSIAIRLSFIMTRVV